MKKDVFETWLREFCSLVFIQTIQAFIFAIVLTIIISTISGNMDTFNASVDNEDLLASTGIIAIIALASISKIEELVRKIFGVSSSLTDPTIKGGLKSFATGMVAAKLAGRVLNNVGKVGSGAVGIIGANKDMNRARSRFIRDSGLVIGSNRNGGAAQGGGAEPPSNPPPTDNGGGSGYLGDGSGGYSVGSGGGDDYSTGSSYGPSVGTSASGGGIPASASSASGPEQPAPQDLGLRIKNANVLDQEKLNKISDAYEDALAEAKKKRRQGVLSIASGGLETIGAIGGGFTGAAAGAAVGEIEEILKGAGVGMGIGDAIGSLPSKGLNAAFDISGQLKSAEKQKDNFVKYVEKSFSDVKPRGKAINSNYRQAKRAVDQIRKEIDKNINAGNMDD